MKSKKNVIAIVVGIISIASINAQDKSDVKDSNDIFNSIMLTMPKEMKARVDSASKEVEMKKSDSGSRYKVGDDSKSPITINGDSYHTSLEKLPDAIREQVLKTMKELESDQNTRVIEFKEINGFKNK